MNLDAGIGIYYTYDAKRRESVLECNRQNYAIIFAAKKEILSQIRCAVMWHLIYDIANVVVDYCGFKRYIDIGN